MNDAELILKDVVNINTAGNHEATVANYLQDLLHQHDITTEMVTLSPHRVGLIATIGNSKGPTIAFDGHQDTVALGDLEQWDYNPLSGEKVDGKIYGRGTTDMKAGLVAAVLAMIRLKDREAELNGTFKLFATVGEESGETGAEQMVDLGLATGIDALITGEPSGLPLDFIATIPAGQSFPGIIMDEDIHDIVAANHSTEQHFLQIAHKGALTYQVISQGVAAHSSMPVLGVNAINGLLKFVDRQEEIFKEIRKPSNPILGHTTPVITEFDGGEQPNTVPGSATMTVFIRTIPEVPQPEIIKQLEAVIAELNAVGEAQLQLEIDFQHASVYSDENSKLSRIAKPISERILKQKLPFVGVPVGTDASQFAKVNPEMDVLIFGPGNITFHQVNEYVDATMYHNFIDIYEEVIATYLK